MEEKLKERFKKYRESKGYSYKKMSTEIGEVSSVCLWKWVNNKTSMTGKKMNVVEKFLEQNGF